MKVIDRYLFREYIVSLVCCLCVFSLLFIVERLFARASDFLRAGMPLWDMFRFYAHTVVAYADQENVSTLVRILPASVLVGSLYSLSQLTKHNELIAMRASGVSLHRLMYPFLGVGLACSLLATAVQESVAPRSSRIVDELEQKWRKGGGQKPPIKRNFKYRGENTIWRIEQLDLANPNVLQGVTVDIERRDQPTWIARIQADKAEWRDGYWWFYGRKIRLYGPDETPKGPWEGPEPGPVKMWMLVETSQDFVRKIETDSDTLERYSTSVGILRSLRGRRDVHAGPVVSKRVDAHRRLAMPWACLVAALVSIPAGIRGGRRGALAGVLLGVLLFFAYYWSIYFAAFLGKRQIIAPWLSAWLPNMVFFVVGAVMISRMK